MGKQLSAIYRPDDRGLVFAEVHHLLRYSSEENEYSNLDIKLNSKRDPRKETRKMSLKEHEGAAMVEKCPWIQAKS
jgi:hypothetical protein